MNFYFLKEVNSEIKLLKKHQELTGENFNIFSIMSMETDEVFTHSAILGEFLNPKGSHGLGSEPLRIFTRMICDKPVELDFDRAISFTEEFIGTISQDETEGGRLDIIVKDPKNNALIIENKIYAGEQKNQLLRYRNAYPKAPLLYLTLYGKESEEFSNGAEDDNFKTISYEKDILQWLEECIKIASEKPMVREVLVQYKNLIKKLTNQSVNKEMEISVKEIIKNNLEACGEIKRNFENAVKELQEVFLKDLEEDLKKELNGYIIGSETYRSDHTVKISNPLNNFEYRFRIKTQKYPVITVTSKSTITNNFLQRLRFKETQLADKNLELWEIIGTFSEKDLIEPTRENNLLRFKNRLLEVIRVTESYDKTEKS